MRNDPFRSLAEQTPTGHIHSRKDFSWHEHADGWALHAIGHRSAIVRVVIDKVWPGMWRVRHPDGRLSDMANLTWAKDGAIAVAMRWLDPRKVSRKKTAGLSTRRKAEQSRPVASPCVKSRRPLPTHRPRSNHASKRVWRAVHSHP
jgi:hypothetical protein